MLRLHGFSSSNYYNVAKLALLEKGIEFEEVLVYTSAGDDYLAMSPMGKVPCLETATGFISESRIIVDYLEDLSPEVPLLPADPVERAKTRELMQVIELYLELSVRRLFPEAFFGGQVSDETKTEVSAVLEKAVAALQRLASFDRFILGDTFGAADISAVIHFPMVTNAAAPVYGADPLAPVPGLSAYLERMEARPTVQRVREDAAKDMPSFMAHIARTYLPPSS